MQFSSESYLINLCTFSKIKDFCATLTHIRINFFFCKTKASDPFWTAQRCVANYRPRGQSSRWEQPLGATAAFSPESSASQGEPWSRLCRGRPSRMGFDHLRSADFKPAYRKKYKMQLERTEAAPRLWMGQNVIRSMFGTSVTVKLSESILLR